MLKVVNLQVLPFLSYLEMIVRGVNLSPPLPTQIKVKVGDNKTKRKILDDEESKKSSIRKSSVKKRLLRSHEMARLPSYYKYYKFVTL